MTGTPQARKLGLKAGMQVAFDEPPDGWELTEAPAGMLVADADGPADVILAFFRAAGEITDRLPALAQHRRYEAVAPAWNVRDVALTGSTIAKRLAQRSITAELDVLVDVRGALSPAAGDDLDFLGMRNELRHQLLLAFCR